MEGASFTEIISPQLAIVSSLKGIFHSRQSPFQRIDVVETDMWGKCLVLDGHMQSTENDEFCFHEAIIHPVLLAHPNPRTVFVGGGGEGATIREVLRYKSVERVVMVDIDGECVDVSKKYLSQLHKGSFHDPRAEIIVADAKAWLEQTQEKFDIMVFDLSDPIEGGPAKMLYTKQFYEMILSKLNKGGMFVTQSGPAGVLSHRQVFTAIHKTLSCVFPSTYAYTSHVPSFMDAWGFNLATSIPFEMNILSSEEIDKRLKERLKDPDCLKYYDGATHIAMFTLNKILRKSLATEDRIITEDAPLFMP